MKRLILALILAMTAPAVAGGPVVVEDETDVVTAATPRSNWIVPVVVGLIVVGLIANSGDDDADPVDPGPKPCPLTEGSC